jgi:Putative addiction module component
LASLDGPADADATEAWDAEVERRLDDLRSGKARTVGAEEAPSKTGIQVIAEIRNLVGSSLKAILVTGDTSSAIRELERDHRVGLASKPINADELLGMLKSLLAI